MTNLVLQLEEFDISQLRSFFFELCREYPRFLADTAVETNNVNGQEVLEKLLPWMDANNLDSLKLDTLIYKYNQISDYIILDPDTTEYILNPNAKNLQLIREQAISTAIKNTPEIQITYVDGIPAFTDDLNTWFSRSLQIELIASFGGMLTQPDLYKLSFLHSISKLSFASHNPAKKELIHILLDVLNAFVGAGTATAYQQLATSIDNPTKLNLLTADLAKLMQLDINKFAFMVHDHFDSENYTWNNQLEPEKNIGLLNWDLILTSHLLLKNSGRCPALPSLMLLIGKIEDYFHRSKII